MSKVLAATCVGGIVTCKGVPVPGVTILTKGTGASSGLLILEEGEATYVATNTTDISGTIDKIVEITNKILETITAVNSAHTGPTTAPSPAVATNTPLINAMVSQLNLLKGNLK